MTRSRLDSESEARRSTDFLRCAVGGSLLFPCGSLGVHGFAERIRVCRERLFGLIEGFQRIGVGGICGKRVKKGLQCFPHGGYRCDEGRQGFDDFAFFVLGLETGFALLKDSLAVSGHKVEVFFDLSPVEPDDGENVLFLFRGKIVDFASHPSVDVACVDHQDLVAVFMRFLPG